MRKRKKNDEVAKHTAVSVIIVLAMAISGFAGIMASDNESIMNVSEDSDELRDLLRRYNVTEDRITVSGIEYTMDELLDMYRKYNITENDLKFAMGELPHYLEGSILDGKHRVIATETGEPPERLPPEWLKEGDYIIITIEERGAISREAGERYIEKYGVDQGNTKIDVANGIPFPVGEVRKLVESGLLAPLE